MPKVTRCMLDMDGEMVPDSDGMWVHYNEVHELRKALDLAIQKISWIRLELKGTSCRDIMPDDIKDCDDFARIRELHGIIQKQKEIIEEKRLRILGLLMD